MKFLRKYHKWLGVFVVLNLTIFSLSGIIINHRQFFSSIDVNRKVLPKGFRYNNWNNGAIKSTIKLNDGRILIYGNIGIWKTDSSLLKFSNFSEGFPKGIDNKKVCKIFQTNSGRLFAGSLFGLYEYNFKSLFWEKKTTSKDNSRIVDILERNNNLLLLSRSDITVFNLQTNKFKTFTLPPPENYDNKIGLFKTIWIIHSGEVWGEVGKLIIDFVALVLIFLGYTGLILFFKKRKIKKKSTTVTKRTSHINNIKWNLKWHNKIGWITAILLIITSFTGMFLRAPLLPLITDTKINKISYTILDTPNPWFDKLRRFIYDEESQRFYIATLEGIIYSDDNFSSPLKKLKVQAPTSEAGITVFLSQGDSILLAGSVEGLFSLNLNTNYVENYITKKPYIKSNKRGMNREKGIFAGYSTDLKEEVWFDYNKGLKSINNTTFFTEMPKGLKKIPISLWSASTEFHTGRIFKPIFGPFYLIIIPLAGFVSLFLIISGFIVWFKPYIKKRIRRRKAKQ